jgi:hypothetical protein
VECLPQCGLKDRFLFLPLSTFLYSPVSLCPSGEQWPHPIGATPCRWITAWALCWDALNLMQTRCWPPFPGGEFSIACSHPLPVFAPRLSPLLNSPVPPPSSAGQPWPHLETINRKQDVQKGGASPVAPMWQEGKGLSVRVEEGS